MAAAAGDVLGLPYLIYGQRARLMAPLLDADGDLVTGATTPDSEISKDQGTFADCTNEMTEIATSSGMYYLDLIQSETQASSIALILKSATAGMKTTPIVIPIRRLPVLRAGTAQAGAAGTITLDSGASAKDDFYNGLIIQCSNDTPANVAGQTRWIIDYNGTTKVATVHANWGTNPSSSTTFDILVPETSNVPAWAYKEVADPTNNGVLEVDITHFGGTAGTFSGGRPEVNTSHAAGTAWNSGAIGAATLAADTITAAKIANAAIDAATFAAGAIDAAAIAADAITAAKVADDVSTEIANKTWDTDATGHQTQGTFGQAIGDPAADADTIWGLANTNLDATVSSRATQASVDAVDNFVDTEIADIQARLPAALTAGGNMKSDALAISGDTVAADRLEALMDGTIIAQINDLGATTTTFIADGFTEATNDHFNGRLITFISGALSGQQTSISDYTGATQTFTVVALTEAPADNDFFVIH